MPESNRFGVGESYDRPPGNILVFPESGLEAAPSLSEDENDFHPEIFNSTGPELEAASRVAWASDRTSPCYSHLLSAGDDTVKADKSFVFTKAALELYLAANRYSPKGNSDVIVFGLRGARLKGAEKLELADQVPLEEVRPDHFNFRCVIGYFFRNTGKFSVYTGSTVPWHKYMSAGELKYNLLPTGCYVYKKGAHRPANEDRWVDPAFRLSDATGAESGPATVLRTARDTVFEMTDTWDKCEPSDNIHCAYSDEKFSSLGCQTVKGGMHDGLWARFQATIKALPKGARVDYVLLTGAEASLAAAFARDGKTFTDTDVHRQLGRLRVGSEGEAVVRLQSALGLPSSSYFGPATKKRLTDLQKQKGVPTDGIFAPAIEGSLAPGVFGIQASPLVQAPHQAPTPPPVAATVAAANPSDSPMVPPITPVAPASAPTPPAQSPPVSRPAPATPSVAAPAASSATALLARDTLRRMAPRPSNAAKAKIWDAYMDALTSEAGAQVFAKYELDKNPQRLVFILANMCAETGGLTLIWESMNYSADRLVDIFGHAANIDHDEARRLAGNQQAIGERVYGLGNKRKAKELGNTEPGDGFRYRGGGFLQTTGRYNYRKIGQKIGEDLEGRPELIENPLISLKAACAEWHGTKLNDYADQGSFRACCNGINYGNPTKDRKPIGFKDRLEYLERGLSAFHLPPVKRKPGALESMEDPEALECGDLGPAVAGIQRRLNALGYPAGPPNGQFTTATRDAVLSFQANNGLSTTGVTDKETRATLEQPDAVPYADARGAGQDDAPPVPLRPVVTAPVAVTPPVALPAPAPASRPAAPVHEEGRGAAKTTLALVLVGLVLTLAVLAALVGWLPLSPGMRMIAGDAAIPLMLMGWIMGLLAAIQALRSRTPSA